MKFPRAKKRNRRHGWTLDYDYIKEVSKVLDKSCRIGYINTMILEDIEEILLAIETVEEKKCGNP